MFLLIAIFLLFAAAVALLILNKVRPNFGAAWLIAAGVALTDEILLVFLRLRQPEIVLPVIWQPSDIFPASPELMLDRLSWPFAFSLVTLLLAVILTATARIRYQTNPTAWASSMILTAAGLLTVFAGNPLALAISWAVMDTAELVILLLYMKQDQLVNRVVLAFSARSAGIACLTWAILSGGMGGDHFDLSKIPSKVAVFFVLAAGLRLGVLPLHLPFVHEPFMRRGLITMLRLAPVASSLLLLARLPVDVVPEIWQTPLLALTILAGVYSAVMWLFSKDEIEGRPYWLIGWASLAVACVIRGHPHASLAWSLALMLPGGMLFLYSARGRVLLFLPMVGLWGLAGLPFSPAASGWHGLVEGSAWLISAFFVLIQFLLMIGFLRHAMKPSDDLALVERWAQATYPAGLILILAADVLLAIWGWPGSLVSNLYFEAVGGILGVALFSVLAWRRPIWTQALSSNQKWFVSSVSWLAFRLSRILRLDWFYGILGFIYKIFQNIITAASAILEGDGGLLWAALLFVLVLSLARG